MQSIDQGPEFPSVVARMFKPVEKRWLLVLLFASMQVEEIQETDKQAKLRHKAKANRCVFKNPIFSFPLFFGVAAAVVWLKCLSRGDKGQAESPPRPSSCSFLVAILLPLLAGVYPPNPIPLSSIPLSLSLPLGFCTIGHFRLVSV